MRVSSDLYKHARAKIADGIALSVLGTLSYAYAVPRVFAQALHLYVQGCGISVYLSSHDSSNAGLSPHAPLQFARQDPL